MFVFFITFCITAMILALVGIINFRLINKKIENNAKMELNNLSLKTNTLRIFTYISVIFAALVDLKFKELFPRIGISDERIIILLIDGGLMVLVIMLLSSISFRFFIYKSDIIKPSYEGSIILEENLDENLKLINMLKKSYSIACIGLIIALLFLEAKLAVPWIIILGGGWIWFGSYDVIIKTPKEIINTTVYKFGKNDWVFYGLMTILVFTIMIAVKYQTESTMEIVIGVSGAFFFMGILTMILGNYIINGKSWIKKV